MRNISILERDDGPLLHIVDHEETSHPNDLGIAFSLSEEEATELMRLLVNRHTEDLKPKQ